MNITHTPSTVTSPEPLAAGSLRALTRPVEGVYSQPPLHWVGDGFRVAGYFSMIPDAIRKLDPFLLLDYHPEYHYSPTSARRGVGVHPHRGFETVTLAFQGSVAHHDSAGGGGVIGPGDVQWMTAGAGVLHKEYHEANFGRSGGVFHMAQLWVNLPRKYKMTAPRYQPLLASQMGVAKLPNDAGSVRVIAGSYRDARGPASTFSPIDILHADLSSGGSTEFTFPSHHTLAIVVMKGQVEFNQHTRAKADDFVLFERSGHTVTVTALDRSELLVLSGEPIAEPVVQYGPFVMNTPAEIRQAFTDYQAGKFGDLED